MVKICGQDFLWAQELVANEQETRDQALADTTDFLSKQKELTEKDSRDVWYLLWNALWMTDRVLTQHDFCARICKIIDVLPKENVHIFMEAFFYIMSDKWETLDKWRTEKYLVLGRKFLDKIVEYCKANNEIEYIPEIVKYALHTEKGNALKMHVVDVIVDYLPEFVQIDTKKAYVYLGPFVEYFTKEHGKPSVSSRINERIITPLIDSIGEVFFGDDEEAALKYLRSLQASLNYAAKHPDPCRRNQELIMQKQQEVREVLVAINQKRAKEGKPILKIDKVD